jgi:hypothetical protein
MLELARGGYETRQRTADSLDRERETRPECWKSRELGSRQRSSMMGEQAGGCKSEGCMIPVPVIPHLTFEGGGILECWEAVPG